MYFSELFGIDAPEQYDWFDPILEVDSLLFVDPFLVFEEADDPRWASAHEFIMQYFDSVFKLLASGNNRPGLQRDKAVTLMTFPEPRELRLGYTAKGTGGAGAGKGLAEQVVRAMSSAITRGLEDIRHFEELGILVDRFGRDRISDVTCNLLKPQIIEYTQSVCQEFGIQMERRKIPHGMFLERRNRWVPAEVDVPVDPAGRPILLLPKRFLCELPTLDARRWFDEMDSELREDLNLHIYDKIKKSDILAAARQNINVFRSWIEREEAEQHDPYDVDIDPMLYVQWQRVSRQAADTFPNQSARQIASEHEMLEFAHEIIGYVQHWAENQGGWRLFWKDVSAYKSIPESSMQILFLGMMSCYCDAVGVRMDREVETGRGPVDFTLSGDRQMRILIEMKKLTHGEFWLGLRDQTPIYLTSQRAKNAIFLVIRNSQTKNMQKRWADLPAAANLVNAEQDLNIKIEGINVMPKLSASNRNPNALGAEVGEAEDADPDMSVVDLDTRKDGEDT